jgi:hypothetical protein
MNEPRRTIGMISHFLLKDDIEDIENPLPLDARRAEHIGHPPRDGRRPVSVGVLLKEAAEELCEKGRGVMSMATADKRADKRRDRPRGNAVSEG